MLRGLDTPIRAGGPSCSSRQVQPRSQCLCGLRFFIGLVETIGLLTPGHSSWLRGRGEIDRLDCRFKDARRSLNAGDQEGALFALFFVVLQRCRLDRLDARRLGRTSRIYEANHCPLLSTTGETDCLVWPTPVELYDIRNQGSWLHRPARRRPATGRPDKFSARDYLPIEMKFPDCASTAQGGQVGVVTGPPSG